MGIKLSSIQNMEELGLFKRPGTTILDIGSSSLYSAMPEAIKRFLTRHSPSSTDEIDSFAARLASGSHYDSVNGGCNEAFVSELLEMAGMLYASFDIAGGYRTTIHNRSAHPR